MTAIHEVETQIPDCDVASVCLGVGAPAEKAGLHENENCSAIGARHVFTLRHTNTTCLDKFLSPFQH